MIRDIFMDFLISSVQVGSGPDVDPDDGVGILIDGPTSCRGPKESLLINAQGVWPNHRPVVLGKDSSCSKVCGCWIPGGDQIFRDLGHVKVIVLVHDEAVRLGGLV